MQLKIRAILLCCFCSSCGAFKPPSPCKIPHHQRNENSQVHESRLVLSSNPQSILDVSDQVLAAWTFAFASSHIGMSATRSNIIRSLGETADSLRLVGNEGWSLPNWWPGDNTGGNKIFPDSLTAGRQIYRGLYTAVSFLTLGNAFGAYLHSSSISIRTSDIDSTLYNLCMLSAALSFGAALSSLVNASPLGLMPSFEADDGVKDKSGSIAGIRRDDTLKFTTRGLTRITRHPLILPVVPWGVASAVLTGGRPCDAILFLGLSMYAIAGCWAQDLRVIREEGSVGTVFQTETRDDGDEMPERTQLKSFFEQTSFVPFKAVLDGRQSINDILREFPWLQFVAGSIAGVYIEEKMLLLLAELSG